MSEGAVVEAPRPGLYQATPFDEYASWEAVNHTILQGFSRTPAHVRYELDHGGKEPTRSLDIGWLVHLATLEPARFEAEIVVPPKVDRRTKEGKAVWERFSAANPGKRFVPAEDHGAVLAMRDALLAHPTAGEFLKSRGVAELSVLWEDAEHAVLCKARIDRIGYVGEWPIVGDVKTARNASRRAFERAAYDYGYHVQAVHYLAGLHALVPTEEGRPFRRFVFFVVESEPPHCVAAYELDEASLAQAEQDRQRYLRTWRRCVESGQWPGYDAGLQLASLPSWVFKSWDLAD